MTATPERIRRCNRESEFAVVSDPAVLASRPDAKPTGDDDFTIDSFFDLTQHAQKLLEQKFAVISRGRLTEAGETAVPLRIGKEVPITPFIPRARMRDSTRGLDRTQIITGLASDHQTEHNSIEAVG